MPAVTRSLINDDFELGHGTDDGEHGAAHWAVRVNLVLDADEANPEVIEFFQRSQEMARVAGKAVELPNQHTVNFVVPSRRHKRIQLRPAFSSS